MKKTGYNHTRKLSIKLALKWNTAYVKFRQLQTMSLIEPKKIYTSQENTKTT